MASLTRNPGPGAPPSAPSSAAAPAVPQAPAPIVAPSSVPMRRRRPGVIAAAIGLTALGGLVSAALYIQTGHRVAVLAVAVPLTEGQQITAQDLVVADVSLDPAVASIPASQESSVVGKRAAMQLAPGALLARADVTNAPLQPAGTSVVGVQLKPGQLPAGRLSVGEQVELVYTPSSAQSALSTGSASSTQLPTTVAATIVNVGAVDTQGNETVDVAVTATLAPGLAAQAATGDIALIAVSAGGN